MGRPEFICEPVDLIANTAIPARKLVFMFVVITLIPLLTLGVKTPSGDAAGTLMACMRLSIHLEVACKMWQIFKTTVTDSITGDVTKEISLVETPPGRLAPNTRRQTLEFLDVYPLCTLWETSHTELCNIPVTILLFTAPPPPLGITHPSNSMQPNRIRVAFVPIQTFKQPVASPIGPTCGPPDGEKVTLLIYSLIILKFCEYDLCTVKWTKVRML